MPADGLPQRRPDRVLYAELARGGDDDGCDAGHVRLGDLREEVVHGLKVERADEEGRQGRVVRVVLCCLDWCAVKR